MEGVECHRDGHRLWLLTWRRLLHIIELEGSIDFGCWAFLHYIRGTLNAIELRTLESTTTRAQTELCL